MKLTGYKIIFILLSIIFWIGWFTIGFDNFKYKHENDKYIELEFTFISIVFIIFYFVLYYTFNINVLFITKPFKIIHKLLKKEII